MDAYAPAYLAHNLPLLILSGLGPLQETNAKLEEDGVHIASDLPLVESADAQALLRYFQDRDGRHLAWNGRDDNGQTRYRVKAVGRDHVVPARNAQLPSSSTRPSNSQSASSSPKPILHSPLSPLSPGSSLFPDGLVDPKWIEKHQEYIPSAYISFYAFTSDPNLSTLHDNQLKSDINNIKGVLSQSGYKFRLIVALLSEGSIVQSPDVEDRLANIRKATGLDSKTSLFFLPPQSSRVELQAFVETIISTVYPLCMEYYRDLSKRSRRKRNRGTVPSPTVPPTWGTSQTLSIQGWTVRYDFKLGVFAEFRAEMDVALRSYESGYDCLLGPDVLETIASWSPRWNEARMLADIFAIRILRCLLWNGNASAAVRRWLLHRERIRDFVDRRGKGSATYGWEAWEARWATVMAEMTKKAQLADFTSAKSAIYVSAQKPMTVGERIQPWEYLHHSGYWFLSAVKHLLARRVLAMAIPEEDRSPPGSSPASLIASKAYTYDTYLCPEPHEENPLPGHAGVDHSQLIIDALAKAIAEFEQTGQFRLVQELYLQLANENITRGAWDEAMRILRPLWQTMTFRKEGWWSAAEEVGWSLRKAAAHTGDGGTIVSVDWELLNRSFICRPNWHYDLTKSLEGLERVKAKPLVVLHNEEIHSFLSATYTFEDPEGKVGGLCTSQFSITSCAHPASEPITMTDIRIEFEGSMKPLILRHSQDAANTPGEVSFSKVSLAETVTEYQGQTSRTQPPQDGRTMMVGKSNLTFRSDQTRVYEFSSLLREAGEATVLSATFSLNSDLFDLEYIHKFEKRNIPHVWWGEHSFKKKLIRANPSSIVILPKPPKVELEFINLHEQYYTNEQINLQLEVINGEDVESIATLDVRLLGQNTPPLALKLATTSDNQFDGNEHHSSMPGISLGKIASAKSTIVEISISPVDIPAIYDLSLTAAYHLVSDLETPVSRSMSIQLSVISPFEANYDFSPRIHPDPWPTFFSHNEADDVGLNHKENEAYGLAQKWCLSTRYASFASEVLIVDDVDVAVLGVKGGVRCSTKKLTTIPDGGVRVSPKNLEEAQFDVFTQKVSLDDRGTATLDVSVAIRWRRDGEESALNTTILPVPRLLVSSIEPRVLAEVSYSMAAPPMIHFDVTIENPSNHFLTFGLTMEPSDEFAFSGVKQITLQLLPLSRRTIRFRLLPLVHGQWIGPIRCVIRDRYFQKVLKIAPTDGMKVDKDGIIIWVPPEEDY